MKWCGNHILKQKPSITGNTGELHETAIKFAGKVPSALVVSGAASTIKQETLQFSNLVIQYTTTGQTVVEVGDNVLLYILGVSSLCGYGNLL